MNRKFLLIHLGLLLSFTSVFAQADDASLWTNIYLEKRIIKGIDAHINQAVRFNNNMTRFDLVYWDMGLGYRLAKWVTLNTDYVFTSKEDIGRNRRNDYTSVRHQGYVSLNFHTDLSPAFRVSFRTMAQGQIKDASTDGEDTAPTYVYRNKIAVKYKLTRRIIPYTSFEINYRFMNPKRDNDFNRTRNFLGVFYKISQRSDLELYTMYERNFNIKSPYDRFILGVGFAHNFK